MARKQPFENTNVPENGIDKGPEMSEYAVLKPEGLLFENLREWLTHTEASEYLRVSEGALRNMVWRGKVPCYKLGRRSRYFRRDLLNLLLRSAKGGLQ